MTNLGSISIARMQTAKKEKETFRISDLPYIFIAGGFIGTVYEFLLTLFSTGVFEDHSGSILTPCNYVYGIGALVMFLVLYQMKNPLCIFLIGSLLGGIIEFGLSLGQQLLVGSTSWDYSNKLLNIGGRTTIPFMLIWGILCLLCTKLVFPILLKLIHKIQERTKKMIAIVILCVLFVDIIVTLSATMRYAQRASDMPTQNMIFQFVDKRFDDKFMAKHFANMVVHR